MKPEDEKRASPRPTSYVSRFTSLPLHLTTHRLATAILFIAIFAMAARPPMAADTWWHLQAGRVTLEQGRILQTDPFSHTRQGAPWVNHSWLSQVVLYWLFRHFSYPGLGLLMGVLVTVSFVFIYLQMEGGAFSRAFITVLAAATSAVTWIARPHLFSFLLTAIVGYLVYLFKWKEVNRLWLLPPLFILWVNLHAAYALGFMILVAFVAGEVLNHLLPAVTPPPGNGGGRVGAVTPPPPRGGGWVGAETPPPPEGRAGTMGAETTPPSEGGAGTMGAETPPPPEGRAGTMGATTTPPPRSEEARVGAVTPPPPRGGGRVGALTTPTVSWRGIGLVLGVTAISFLVLVLHPNTTRMWTYYLDTVRIEALQDFIQEWRSPDFHLLQMQPFVWMLLGTLAAIGLSGRRLDGTDLFLVGMFAYAALLAARNISPFALVTAPVLSRHVTAIGRRRPRLRLRNLSPSPIRAAINWALLLLVLALAVFQVHRVLRPAHNEALHRQTLPVAAVDWIEEREPEGEIFNHYNWGGYLIWRLWPEYRVFVDGRTDLYGDAFLRRYLQVQTAQPGFERILADHDVNLILTPTGGVLSTQLACHGGWQQAYRDDLATIWIHQGPGQ